MLRGTIIADESYLGGKPGNIHASRRPKLHGGRGSVTNKTTVFSLIHKESGEVRSRIIPDVSGITLRKALEEHVDMPVSVLYSDGWKPYGRVGRGWRAMSSWTRTS